MTATKPDAKGPQPRVMHATCGLRFAFREEDFDPVTRRFRREDAVRLQQLYVCDDDGYKIWHDVPTVVETAEDAKGRSNV